VKVAEFNFSLICLARSLYRPDRDVRIDG